MIEQVDNNTFKTVSRNGLSTMTLIRSGDGWEVWTRNASTRAYLGNMPSVKRFNSLEDVEKRYRSFARITALVSDHTNLTGRPQ